MAERNITMKNSLLRKFIGKFEEHYQDNVDELWDAHSLVKNVRHLLDLNTTEKEENDEYIKVLKDLENKSENERAGLYVDISKQTAEEINDAAFNNKHSEYFRIFKKLLAGNKETTRMNAELFTEFASENGENIRITKDTAEKYANRINNTKGSMIIPTIKVSVGEKSYRVRPNPANCSPEKQTRVLTPEQVLDPDGHIPYTDYAYVTVNKDKFKAWTAIDGDMLDAKNEDDIDNLQGIRDTLLAAVLELYIRKEKRMENERLSKRISEPFGKMLDRQIDEQEQIELYNEYEY